MSKQFVVIIALMLMQVNLAAAEAQDPNSPSEKSSNSLADSQGFGLQKRVTLKIRARGSGRPLSRSEIRINNQDPVFADRQGGYELDFSNAKVESIQISRFGFEDLRLDLKDAPSEGDWEIFLQPSQPNENEVVITGKRRQEVSRKSISVREAARISPSGDPIQVARFMPGVQRRPFNPRIIVRGSGPNDSLYFIDNMQIPDIFHRLGNISVLPELFTDSVEFSAGGFGGQYGDRHGGVVSLRTTTEIPEHARTELRMNLPLYSSIFHERPLSEESAIAVSFRRSYVDAFIPLFVDEDALTLSPAFGDVHARYLTKTANGSNKFWMVGSQDTMRLATPLPEGGNEDGRGEFDIRSGFGLVGFEMQRNLGRGWTMSSTPHIINSQENTRILDNRLVENRLQSRIYHEFRQRREQGQFSFYGIELNRVDVQTDLLVPFFDRSDPFFDFEDAPKQELKRSYTGINYAVWAHHDLSLLGVIFSPSVRAFFNDQIEEFSYDPRLSARFEFGEGKHALKSAVGQYSQSPTQGQATAEFGNPDLSYERSMHYIAGYEWHPSPRWSLDVQGYYKTTDQLIRPDPDLRYNNEGLRRSSGFEFFLRRNPTDRWFLWLAYTYANTQERSAPDQDFHPSPFDQTHVLNLAGDYNFSSAWSLGSVFSYNTGDTYTPIRRGLYNANLDKYVGISDQEQIYGRRLPDFHQLDVYANYDYFAQLWKLSVKFGFQFLALEPQAIQLQYNYDYTKEEYFTGLPPIPFFELKGVF